MCGEFDLFVDRVDPRYQSHVSEIHSELMKRGCRLEMKTAKSGFVVSYIRKASVCKRLLDPNDCNPRCRMGYTFVMEGEQYQKCRYMAFLLTLNEESHPYILQLLHKELDRVDSES